VHLTLKQRTLTSRWEYSENQPLADLQGLTKAQLRSASADVKFTMDRDAGSFVFEGSVNLGIGSGTFSFVPDATSRPSWRRSATTPSPRTRSSRWPFAT
jgi:hypothetical protein